MALVDGLVDIREDVATHDVAHRQVVGTGDTTVTLITIRGMPSSSDRATEPATTNSPPPKSRAMPPHDLQGTGQEVRHERDTYSQ